MQKTKAILLIMALLLMILGGCAPKQTGPKTDPSALTAVEVKEYQGEKLSSVTDLKGTSIKGAQYVDVSTYKLQVSGLAGSPREYTYDEVLGHTKHSVVVTLNCVEGWSAKILWEGILLRDLFDEVNVKDTAKTVIFHCADGYTTSMPLQTVIQNNLMLAYKINGVTLTPELGFPFQFVAQDKFGYKWAKWITGIELSDNADYKGYWESLGYSNEGDVKK